MCGPFAGTSFMVDGFQFANPRCVHYFLTHFHSDHTIGLTKGFSQGRIYCSPITANLLLHDFGVSPSVVQQLGLNERQQIDGVYVTPLDANHCPGACMFLFEVPTDRGKYHNILHTGDCRHVGLCTACCCA